LQGVYKDVNDLFKTAEVKTFQKLKWGGGPVKFFWGLAEMNHDTKSGWEAHVIRVDKIVSTILPPCIVISIACILSIRDLAGLGSAALPLPGIPDL
jgi:hypothetical protein